MEPALFTDPANVTLIVGLALLGLDIAVIGLSPIMFVALGSLVTSAALYVSGARPGLVETAAIAAALSVAVALLGRKPLQQFQSAGVKEDQSSDLIGRELTATDDVTKESGRVHWSGLYWEARLSPDAKVDRIVAGARARVTRVENLALVLEPIA